MTGLRLEPGQGGRFVGQTGAMTGRGELTRRARAHGVAVSYQNWRGRLVEVPDETLAAVLGALGGASGGTTAPDPPLRGARPPVPAGGGAVPGSPVVGLRGAALLGAFARLLGPRRPARSSRPRRLERRRAWRGLRAGQPAARGRAAAAGQPVALPADEPPPDQPALPAHRGHPRIPGAERRRPGPGRGPGRPVARREHHRGAYRPGRGLGRQARRARADPHGAADREPPGRA